jgi:hypothetical protein
MPTKNLSRPWLGRPNSAWVAKWILARPDAGSATCRRLMCSGFSISGRMAGRRLRAVDSSRDAGHSVWLFGDTFVGDPAHGSRVNSALVPNTVGISSCRGNDWSIYYYRGKDGASGTARPIFDTGTDQFRDWPRAFRRLSNSRTSTFTRSQIASHPASIWKKGLDQKGARVLVDAEAPDFSVRFHSALWQWVMVQADSAFPAREIGIRRADRLAGPWSSFRALYDIPEMHALRGPLASSVMRQKNTLSFQRRQTR